MNGYALRSMPDLESNPGTYPVAFRIMWDKDAAMNEMVRLARVEREKGSGVTFSMHEVEIDAPPDPSGSPATPMQQQPQRPQSGTADDLLTALKEADGLFRHIGCCDNTPVWKSEALRVGLLVDAAIRRYEEKA